MAAEHLNTRPHEVELPGIVEVLRRNLVGELHRQAPEVGLVVDGTWELTRRLGEGGFGLVFEAWHLDLERAYAIKLLNARHCSEEVRSRFLAEARLMAEMRSEHLVRVLNYGELPDGTPYFVMDLIKGQTLRQRLREPLPVPRAVEIAEEILTGLAVVHARQVVHGDIKPENIIIGEEDGRVRLLDFGLARTTALVNGRGGTPPYMAPEMLLDEGCADFRADVFAVGVVLYEMLTGRLPRGHSRMDFEQIQRSWRKKPEIDPMRMYCKGVPESLDELVQAALSRDPTARPVSADAMLAELRRVRDQSLPEALVEALSPPGPSTPSTTTTVHDTIMSMSKPHWMGPSIVLVAVAVALVASPMVDWSSDDAAPLEAPAAHSPEVPSLGSVRGEILVAAPLGPSGPSTGAQPASCEALGGEGGSNMPVQCQRMPSTVDEPVIDARVDLGLEEAQPTKARPRARVLTRARFESVMRSLTRVARRCAETIDVFPGTEVTVQVAVDPSGRAEATIGGAEARLPIGTCIDQAVEAKRFDRTRKGGFHEYVFRL